MSVNLRKDLGLDLQQWAQLEMSVKYELHRKKNCVGLKGRKGQPEKWDIWFREFIQGYNMKIFKKLKGQTEFYRLRNWIIVTTEREARCVPVRDAADISLDASRNSNRQLGGVVEDTPQTTQALIHQPKASAEQNIRELSSADSNKSQNALIRKTLGLELPQWDKLLRKIDRDLIKWAWDFNNSIRLSQNNKTSWDKWLRWVIKDSNGCWKNRQVDFNVLLVCFDIMSTMMMRYGDAHATAILKVSRTAAAATNHRGGPPAQSSRVAPKLNACQAKGTLPDMPCVKWSPGYAPAGGVPHHSPGKPSPQTGHLTHFKQNIGKSGSNQGPVQNPVQNPGPSRPSLAIEESSIARPGAFRGDMKFQHNALGFRSKSSSVLFNSLPKKHLTYHGIGGLHLHNDKTSQQLKPQPLSAPSPPADKRPLLDSCKSLVVPCVKFKMISNEKPIVEISAQAMMPQPRVWVPILRKSSLEEEDDYDVF